MENKIIEIREDNLEAVNGGNYLSADEVKDLEEGDRLILENNFGQNIALVAALGEWRDPGIGSMLQAKVQVLELYDHGLLLHGETFSSWVGERLLQVGDIIYVSRYYLDTPERA